MPEHHHLEIFQKSYQNTDLTPLIQPEQLEKFWVEYESESLEKLITAIDHDASRDAKIIFCGHRGCGKSTLLAKFGRHLSDRYFVAFFSIADTIEMSDVNHINILFATGLNLMLQAEKEQIDIPKTVKDSLYRWFATRTRTEVETPVSAEVSVGFDLWQFLVGKLKTEAFIRNELKQEFERKVSELVGKLNEIAAIIQGASQKEVLVIIDDLDKLELAVVRDIFQEVKALFLPGFSIVYTIPIASLRDIFLSSNLRTEANNRIFVMPVLKLMTKEECRREEPSYLSSSVETLCEILYKRIPKEVLPPDVGKQMVLHSGGVLRELMRIANLCCQICLTQIRNHPEERDIQINSVVLEEVIKELRFDFEMPLGKTAYAILQEVYQNFEPDDPQQKEFLDLLHGLHVLEYRNDEMWYDIHPIVVDLLRRKGKIDVGSEA